MEERAIDGVIATLNRALGVSYRITKRPDRDNRRTADVDAYAEAKGRTPLAIEHTRIESLAEQTRDSSRFTDALGPLEEDLKGVFPFWLTLAVSYENAVPGQDWSAIREILKSWLLTYALSLPEGQTRPKIPGIPFAVVISKHTGMGHFFGLSRITPPGDINNHLLSQMHLTLDHKHQTLRSYRSKGAFGVLVLESEDIALVSSQHLYRAFVIANRERPRPNLDQVWLVQSHFDKGGIYCFLGSEELMVVVNSPNSHFGPQFEEEWICEQSDDSN